MLDLQQQQWQKAWFTIKKILLRDLKLNVMDIYQICFRSFSYTFLKNTLKWDKWQWMWMWNVDNLMRNVGDVWCRFWVCDKSERAQFKRLLRELESCVILSFFLCVRHPQQQQAGLESQNGCPKIDGWKRGKYICNCEQKWMFYKPQTVRSCHGWKLNNQSPSNFDMQPLFVDR